MPRKGRLLLFASVVVVVTLAVLFWPTHKLAPKHHWVFKTEKVTFYEMDMMLSEHEPPDVVGEYTKKPFVHQDGFPEMPLWRAVAEPVRLEPSLRKELQRALRVWDRESKRSLLYDCAFQPRTCLRVEQGSNVLDVWICVYCRAVQIRRMDGSIVASGDMHGSYPLFLRAAAKLLPEDKHVKEDLANLDR
jgi:hypothetical protein